MTLKKAQSVRRTCFSILYYEMPDLCSEDNRAQHADRERTTMALTDKTRTLSTLSLCTSLDLENHIPQI